MFPSIKHKNNSLLTLCLAFGMGGLAGFLVASTIRTVRPPMERGDNDRSASPMIEYGRPKTVQFDGKIRSDEEHPRSGITSAEIDFSEPLSKQYDRLKMAADRGDLRAVCKLIHSFDHCVKGGREAEMVESLLDRAAKESDDNLQSNGVLSEIEEIQSRARKMDWFCSDLSIDKDVELTRRTYQAAELGDLGAMVRFSTDPPLGQITLANAEAVYLFTQEAPRILEKAVMRGDINAIRSMFYAQTSGVLDTDYGSVPVNRNPVMLIATANVLRALADEQAKADVDEYLRSPPSDVMKIASSSAVQELQMEIRRSVLKSDKGISAGHPLAIQRSRPPCG